MKKGIRAAVLAMSLLALAGIAAFRAWQGTVTLLGARLADEAQLASLSALTRTGPDSCALLWDGAELPYDAERKAYCLPQPIDGSAKGRLTASWGQVYLPREQWAGGWQQAMEKDRTLEVYVSDGSRWCQLRVFLSGLPVMTLRTSSQSPYINSTLPGETLYYYYGYLDFFWPEGHVRAQLQNSEAEWHWRGNANLASTKKSYRINLRQSGGEAVKLDFLGLGESDSWILLNFATDATRSRDVVSYQFWNELAARNNADPTGPVVEYVELFLDDTYMGVYGLCRPVNRSSLELSRQDILYKWRLSTMITEEGFDWVERDEQLAWYQVLEVTWPNEYEDGVWQPLRRHVNTFCQPQATAGWQEMTELIDLENTVDMALYKQFVAGLDNVMQNQYLLYRGAEGRIYRMPWDMDETFGNAPSSFPEAHLATIAVPDMELDSLYAADARRVKQLVADRWTELRQSIFTLQRVEEKFLAARERLTSSGAWSRDFGLWGETDAGNGWAQVISLDMEEAFAFMEERLIFLDEYLADYVPPSREVFDALPQ